MNATGAAGATVLNRGSVQPRRPRPAAPPPTLYIGTNVRRMVRAPVLRQALQAWVKLHRRSAVMERHLVDQRGPITHRYLVGMAGRRGRGIARTIELGVRRSARAIELVSVRQRSRASIEPSHRRVLRGIAAEVDVGDPRFVRSVRIDSGRVVHQARQIVEVPLGSQRARARVEAEYSLRGRTIDVTSIEVHISQRVTLSPNLRKHLHTQILRSIFEREGQAQDAALLAPLGTVLTRRPASEGSTTVERAAIERLVANGELS